MSADTSTPKNKGQATFTPLHAFFILFVLVAGGLFCFKLFAFMKTIKNDEMAGFAFDPIVQYGLVAMGFGCLLFWAWLTGQFKNVEQPKYDMLERFESQVREEDRLMKEKGL